MSRIAAAKRAATLSLATSLALVGGVAVSASASAEDTGPAAHGSSSSADRPGSAERPDPAEIPYLGVVLQPTDGGLMVRRVLDDGPFAVAGIAAGDTVVSVAGVDVDARGSLREALGDKSPGDTVVVVFVHDGATHTVTVTLASQEDRPGPEDHPYLGARPERPQDRDVAGIEVGEVFAGSPAEAAGLQEGDVIVSANGVDITMPREAFDLLRELSPGDTVVLKVVRGGEEITLTVTLGSQDENPNPPMHRPGGGGERPGQHGPGAGAEDGAGAAA